MQPKHLRVTFVLLAAFASLSAFAFAQTTAVTAPTAPTIPSDPAGKRPLAALPYTPSLEPAFLDRSVDPCADLYHFSCGGWQKLNPIPADEARWSVYDKVSDDNQQFLWGLLEEVAKPRPERSADEQKIGDFFAACMDTAAVEKAGAAPLAADLAAIEAMTSRGGTPVIASLLAEQHLRAGSGALFYFFPEQDPGNSEQVIAWAFAGGLGLPDRDYYLKEDVRSQETRQKYREHVARMLVLTGETTERAASAADTVLRIETALAKVSLSRVERRDPHAIYHRMPITEAQKLAPSFSWDAYLAALGAPLDAKRGDQINVTEPKFFQEVERLLASESLDSWKSYLRWHLVNARAPYLSSTLARADFDFFRGYLRGVQQPPPRWKTCVGWVDEQLGEALGKVFVARTFPPEVKASTLDMVLRIERAMGERIRGLDWMSEPTRKQALGKLAALRNKIGYPDVWRDYAALEIRRGDWIGNLDRATLFEGRRRLAKIGRPVDRGEWAMTPPTVNAYYNPSMNDMNFPAGVLLPPLFDPRLDDAPNYGNTGGTIGHELVHGFDDEGRLFDARGNLADWWTEQDAREFESRTACIVDQYAQYTVVDDIKLNSRLTLGEDVADLAGLILAWDAWKGAVAEQKLEPRDGLTPEQRFFVGFAQWDCSNQRDEDKRVNALTNVHSPSVYRINGVVPNMPEFAAAFHCPADAPLVKPQEKVCRIW